MKLLLIINIAALALAGIALALIGVAHARTEKKLAKYEPNGSRFYKPAKIIKKPKMPTLVCPRCGCVFKPTRSGLIVRNKDYTESHSVTTCCPGCEKVLDVFGEPTNNRRHK